MKGSDYRTVVSAREGGSILVERQLCGVTIDRYNTHDLTKPIKRQAKWIDETIALFSQPSAGVVIDVSPVPALEPGVYAKLEDAEQLNAHLATTVADMVKKASARLLDQPPASNVVASVKVKRKKLIVPEFDLTGAQFCCDNCGHKASMSPCPICGSQLGGCYGGETLKQFDAKWAKHVELYEAPAAMTPNQAREEESNLFLNGEDVGEVTEVRLEMK